MRLYRSQSAQSQRGSAFFELLLVLPVLTILLLATYEFTTLLRGLQLMQGAAREAGREAFRECSQVPVNVCPGGRSAVDACLATVRTRQQFITSAGRRTFATFLNNIDLGLSAYRWEDVSGVSTVVRVGNVESPTCSALQTCSKYSETAIRADTQLSSLIEDKSTVVIAEVYASYVPLFEPLVPAGWAERQYYVRVIY